MKTNDRLLMFLLRAYMPERFAGVADPNHNARTLDHEPPLALAPVSEALARLQPVTPAAPMAQLDVDPGAAFATADLLDGKVPHWHAGRSDFPPPHQRDEEEAAEAAAEAAAEIAAAAAAEAAEEAAPEPDPDADIHIDPDSEEEDDHDVAHDDAPTDTDATDPALLLDSDLFGDADYGTE